MAISISDIIAGLGVDNEETLQIVSVLEPFLPAIKREGQALADEVIKYAIKGEWTELDRVMWEKMTDDERDKLSDEVLKEARDSVDAAYERNQLAKQIAFKVASSLLTLLL